MQVIFACFSRKRIEGFHYALESPKAPAHLSAAPCQDPRCSLMPFQAVGSRWKKLSEVSRVFPVQLLRAAGRSYLFSVMHGHHQYPPTIVCH